MDSGFFLFRFVQLHNVLYGTLTRFLKKSFYTGCAKTYRCKTSDIMRNETYFSYAAVTNDERNAADGRFSTASYSLNSMSA